MVGRDIMSFVAQDVCYLPSPQYASSFVVGCADANTGPAVPPELLI